MNHNGIWGGDLEINAISNYYKRNVIVFQDSRPNLELQSFPKENPVIQLAYFGSCHYCSVRSSKPLSLSDKSSKDNIVLRSDDQVITKKEVKKEPKEMKKEENIKPKKDKIVKKIELTPEQRNMVIIDKCRQKIEAAYHSSHEHKEHHHHHHDDCHSCCEEWNGDLQFDDLVTIPNRIRLIRMKRENQVRKTLKLLTMKCPCKSGSYFKYCCYPKIKSWYFFISAIMCSIKRKRYYLSKFRVCFCLLHFFFELLR